MFKGIFKLNHCTYTFPAHHIDVLHQSQYNGKKVLFTTCRKFKGLESDVVILIDVTQKFMLEQEYKNIVYVGTSRARFELCVVTSLSDNEISEVLATENIKKAKNAEKALATLLNTKLLK